MGGRLVYTVVEYIHTQVGEFHCPHLVAVVGEDVTARVASFQNPSTSSGTTGLEPAMMAGHSLSLCTSITGMNI